MRGLLVFALIALPLPSVTIAHGGGLNAEGCHNDRRNGGYHCHRGSSSARSTAPRSSLGAKSSGGSTYYANCTAARDAGAAPVRAGDPGYSARLDRDGIGCE